MIKPVNTNPWKLGRLAYLVRRTWPGFGRFAGSWKLSIVLMVVWAFYSVLLVIWSSSSPPHIVRNIAGLFPFQVVYAGLLINTLVCLWLRLPLLKRSLLKGMTTQGVNPRWSQPTPGIRDYSEAAVLGNRWGYTMTTGDSGMTYGIKGRWTMLGNFIFHSGFFFIALGFMVSFQLRDEATLCLAEGEGFTNAREQFLDRKPSAWFSQDYSDLSLQVSTIVPRFWRDELLFTSLQAAIVVDQGRSAMTAINRPVPLSWCQFLRLSGFGYTPRYELTTLDGSVLESSFLKLSVFPPGRRDFFHLLHFPHRVYVRLYPDYVAQDGGPATQSCELKRPRFEIQIFRMKQLIAEGLLAPGESLAFEGIKIGFPELRYWGEFSLVRDPGMSLLFFGLTLGLIGLVLSLGGARAEIRWRPGHDQSGGVLEGWLAAHDPGRELTGGNL